MSNAALSVVTGSGQEAIRLSPARHLPRMSFILRLLGLVDSVLMAVAEVAADVSGSTASMSWEMSWLVVMEVEKVMVKAAEVVDSRVGWVEEKLGVSWSTEQLVPAKDTAQARGYL